MYYVIHYNFQKIREEKIKYNKYNKNIWNIKIRNYFIKNVLLKEPYFYYKNKHQNNFFMDIYIFIILLSIRNIKYFNNVKFKINPFENEYKIIFNKQL